MQIKPYITYQQAHSYGPTPVSGIIRPEPA